MNQNSPKPLPITSEKRPAWGVVRSARVRGRGVHSSAFAYELDDLGNLRAIGGHVRRGRGAR
jgi:hypothetical protein